jgi:peptide-methionine (R)-S-oxide reductase
MDSRMRLIAAGSLVLAIVAGAGAGIVVTSQTTNSASLPTGSSFGMPSPVNGSESPVNEKDAEWRSRLTYQQYMVTRKKQTEAPWTGKYWNNKSTGVYKCVCCGTPLFDSSTKFDSGTGWPSFYQPIDEKDVETEVDTSLFTSRTEVLCQKCHAHLGHRFEDGPKPTGFRYSINSAALDFQKGTIAPKPYE